MATVIVVFTYAYFIHQGTSDGLINKREGQHLYSHVTV